MDWSQWLVAAIYAAAMALAFRRRSIAPAVACLVSANFAGMVFADGDLNLMIVVDGLVIAALIYDGSDMGHGLAYAYIASLVIEAWGAAVGLPFYTTSAIVDAMIVPIAAIIGWANGGGGRLDFGLGHHRGWRDGRTHSPGLPMVAGRYPGERLAGHHEAYRRGLT